MHAPCTSRFSAQIDSLLLEELPTRKLKRLREHLAGCPSCQHRYNKIVLASRLLEGGPEALAVPSEGELQRVGVEVLARTRLVPDAAPARRGLFSWIAAAATVGVVLAVALPIALRHEPPTTGPTAAVEASGTGSPVTLPPGSGVEEKVAGPEELQPRGPAARSAQRVLGLRAFCLRQLPGLPAQVTGLAPVTDPASGSASTSSTTCGISDILKFAYTNHSELPYLFLVGLDEKLAIKWYEPHPPARTSLKVRADVVDEPLPRAVRLAVNHTAGQLRLYALFSARPVTAEQVEQAVARLRVAKTPLGRVSALPVSGVAEQQSILVRLQP